MNPNNNGKVFAPDTKFLLGLHSSTETLGLGVIQIDKSGTTFKNSIIKVNRDLSNYLFDFVEDVLPSRLWTQITRLAVSTGPGGYTGTRIKVIFARTLAQQLNCQVDGISSFELMAYRVSKQFIHQHQSQSFWITQALKRRGIVAGKYKIINSESEKIEIKELQAPLLLPLNKKVSPSFEMCHDIEKDLNRLLNISLKFYQQKKKSAWKNILPIYPTSPVQNIQKINNVYSKL